MKKLTVLAIITALVLTVAVFAGCTKTPTEMVLNNSTDLASGGVIVLSVNPKIAVEYDDTGKVTGIIARNDDAMKIVSSCQGLIGLETKEAITRLVDAIGEAGYFVEDIDGNTRQITLEIESGSLLPNDAFLDDIIAAVKNFVSSNDWKSPIDVLGETDYGMTDYVDTDYGVYGDGYTDYHHHSADCTDVNCTNPDHYHHDTDYGVTDYRDTDYGVYSDGVTDYCDTDYGVHGDGVTDYGRTDYHHNSDYGKSDYHDSDYGY